jgi:hypothetical protein
MLDGGRSWSASGADPRFPLLMAGLILAVWFYQLLFNSRSQWRWLLVLRPVRVGLALGMIVYLLVIAQPSLQQFIYFQF